ncbi:MAG: FAD-dependent oxidoreductase [Armatimonadetes bacterium]|jgi:thioredoxin reductase (NADPH)|nr:FAD-dependent oxidoreductase [Armatimonadota bacterium]MDI9583807.1 FAD-dependent oxidoreductase [Acidobacteriota bacterium]NSW57232.1 FAD-dependent oxidoreductase [Armatimonadota bacterium]
MAETEANCDLCVIGAGPAGLTAALYASRAGLNTVVVSPTELSGMAAQAPVVANFPGQAEPIQGRDLVELIRRQAVAAGARHVIASVAGVDFSGEVKLVYAGREVLAAHEVIVATGAMAPAGRLPGEEEYQGRGVCYCTACDGPFYSGENVLVVGDDDQAVEEALNMSTIASSVHLVTGMPEVRVDPELLAALESAENISVRCGMKIQEILGDDDQVIGARFTGDQNEHVLEASGIFLYLRGAAPATEFLMDALETDAKGFIITDDLCRTAVSGVYAAGDVRSKQVRQMVVAAAEGATAALAAESHLRRRASVRLDRGNPGAKSGATE